MSKVQRIQKWSVRMGWGREQNEEQSWRGGQRLGSGQFSEPQVNFGLYLKNNGTQQRALIS